MGKSGTGSGGQSRESMSVPEKSGAKGGIAGSSTGRLRNWKVRVRLPEEKHTCATKNFVTTSARYLRAGSRHHRDPEDRGTQGREASCKGVTVLEIHHGMSAGPSWITSTGMPPEKKGAGHVVLDGGRASSRQRAERRAKVRSSNQLVPKGAVAPVSYRHTGL